MAAAVGMRTHIWNNGLKSMALLACFPILIGLLAYAGLLIVGAGKGLSVEQSLRYGLYHLPATLPWVLGGTAVWFVIAWFLNSWLINLSTGARTLGRREIPRLYNLVENICISQGMPMPKLAIIETDALNAFAAGMTRSQYTVAVTRGLLESLDDDELEAVLAHEIAHIQHGDVRLLVITTIFVGIISFVTDLVFNNLDILLRGVLSSSSGSDNDDRKGGLLAGLAILAITLVIFILTRLLGVLCRLAISRKREFMADMQAVRITRKPEAMIGALRRISGKSEIEGVPADVRPMFFDDAPGFLGAILSTHPTIEDRIAAIAHNAGMTRQ